MRSLVYHGVRGLLLVPLAAMTAASAACSDLLGPDRVDPPTLRSLSVADDLASSLRHDGVFFIRAAPVDAAFRLPRGQRLPVEVTVSSGDLETAGLYRRLCPARERSGYPCFKFQLFMQEGRSVAEVADRIAAIDGRFQLFPGGFATVTVFYPDVVQTARRAARWPGVSHTALWNPGCPRRVAARPSVHP